MAVAKSSDSLESRYFKYALDVVAMTDASSPAVACLACILMSPAIPFASVQAPALELLAELPISVFLMARFAFSLVSLVHPGGHQSESTLMTPSSSS